jgi:hypothetical protein
MSVSEQLRKAIAESGDTHYRIWKETGINSRNLDRFVTGQTELGGRNIDRLCEYLGLELCRKKQQTAGKQPGKKRRTAGKDSAK